VRQSRTYYIYIFGKDVNNFDYLVIWQEATWLYIRGKHGLPKQLPKLATIKAVQRMETDGHGAPITPKDLALHAKRRVGYSKFLAGAVCRKYSVISIVGRTRIQRFRISGFQQNM
jgi:hypothetical protein